MKTSAIIYSLVLLAGTAALAQPAAPTMTAVQRSAALSPVLNCELDPIASLRGDTVHAAATPDQRQHNLARAKASELALQAAEQAAPPRETGLSPAGNRTYDTGVTQLVGPFRAFNMNFETAALSVYGEGLVQLHSPRLNFDAVKSQLEAAGWQFQFVPEMSNAQPYAVWRSTAVPKTAQAANQFGKPRQIILVSGMFEAMTNRHLGAGVTLMCTPSATLKAAPG
jgi:hypothetical protein